MKNGKETICSIKVTSSGHGRIHFDYDEKTKSWGALSDVDYVLYVRTSQDTIDEFEAHLYDQSTVLGAFDENRKTAVQNGFANLPAWLSAELESKDRFVGSGFAKAAIWKETSSVNATPLATVPTIASPHPVRVAIEAAKDRLAKDLGGASSAIEITVRWS